MRHSNRTPKRSQAFQPAVVQLEDRVVPTTSVGSGIAGRIFQPTYVLASTVSGVVSADAAQVGTTVFTPQQIRQAYGLDQIAFGGVQGDGTGETIAIVDAYDQPNIASDLHVFDQTFGLPDPPSFQKIDQSGGTNYPAADANWGMEISLDVEWAHAVAPGANILLVEANSAAASDLFAAVDTARQVPGVVAVSMSWGTAEFSQETSYDTHFQTSAGHQGITFVASSGDYGAGAGVLYPSISSNVLSVGGTSLSLDGGNNWSSESGWSGSGGGPSQYVSQPSYQQGVVAQNYGHRTDPDVAYNADPNTGVYVYDTAYSPAGWYRVGGTSAGAPQWAALVAIADQGRALKGLGSLDGPTQTLPMLYQSPSTDFHDITSGSNGPSGYYNAGPGYDLVTGLGSPVANLLVPDLVSPSAGPQLGGLSTSGMPVNGPGFSLTVTGSNFAPDSVVEWDGTALPTTYVNTNELTAWVGPDLLTTPGTDVIVVTNPSGPQSGTSNELAFAVQQLSWIKVSPSTVTLIDGTTQQFTATGFDQYGNAMSTSPNVSWSLASGSVGTLDSDGLYTAAAPSGGFATIQASSGVFSASVNVSVVTASHYTITDLGSLGGGWTIARGINDSGAVVGTSTTASGASHAFVYSNGQMTDLGTLPGFTGSTADAINASGAVAGSVYNNSGIEHAFLYTAGQMIDLGTLPGGTFSVATGINASGQVVGDADNASGVQDAFLYSNGQMIDLGPLLGPNFTTAPDYSSALGISASGQVLIEAVHITETVTSQGWTDYTYSYHAFVYSGGQMTDLGTLGGQNTYAQAISALGQVVGDSNTASGGDDAFLYSGGVMTDLGPGPTAGDFSSTASAINQWGQMVGYAVANGSGRLDPFLYSGGALTDLYAIAPLTYGQGIYPTGINDSGWIIGYNADAFAGTAQSYLLTPPPPTVVTPAGANPNGVTGTTTSLSVLGGDVQGEAVLSYAWSELNGPAPVVFSANGTNAAKNTLVTFSQTGTYTFQVTIQDEGGLSITSQVTVTVDQTLSRIVVTPNTATINAGSAQLFVATALDQFGNPLTPPPAFTWSVSGVGTIDADGLYVAPFVSGAATIAASSGGVTGTATISLASVGFTVTDLGALGGASYSFAEHINNLGDLVGMSSTSDGSYHAFLSHNGVLTDLGALGSNGWSYSEANGVNDYDQVVGYSTTSTGSFHAFLYQNGTMIDLGTLGGDFSVAEGINDLGQVVGYSSTASGQFHAFLYQNGVMTDLGALGGNGWTFSIATAINDLGQVVGYSTTDSGSSHAFLYQNGTMTDLGVLGCSGWTFSEAESINDLGQIVGMSSTSDGSYHAFVFANGTMTDLGTLGGNGYTYSNASAINDFGQIVGFSSTSSGVYAPFLYSAGVMTDLNTLIAPGQSATPDYVTDINDAGQIIGAGSTTAGGYHALMLSVPESSLTAQSIGALRKRILTSAETAASAGYAAGASSSNLNEGGDYLAALLFGSNQGKSRPS